MRNPEFERIIVENGKRYTFTFWTDKTITIMSVDEGCKSIRVNIKEIFDKFSP